MASCIVELDEQLTQLLTQIENALGIEFSRQEGLNSSTGVTVFSFFSGETPSGPLRIDGYNDHWFPENFDLHITGPAELIRVFCTAIDAWPGSVLQRTDWV